MVRAPSRQGGQSLDSKSSMSSFWIRKHRGLCCFPLLALMLLTTFLAACVENHETWTFVNETDIPVLVQGGTLEGPFLGAGESTSVVVDGPREREPSYTVMAFPFIPGSGPYRVEVDGEVIRGGIGGYVIYCEEIPFEVLQERDLEVTIVANMPTGIMHFSAVAYPKPRAERCPS